MPRTGKIKADSSQAAENKLREKGFTAINVGPCEQAKQAIQVKPQSKGSQVGLAPRRGYRRSWSDLAETSLQASSKMKLAASLLLGLGLLLTIVLWSPSKETLPKQQAQESHSLKLHITATVEAEPEGQRLVIDFPEIPYSWDASLEESLDQERHFNKQFDLSTAKKPGFVKLSILDANSKETQFSEQRSVGEGQTSIDFGPLRWR